MEQKPKKTDTQNPIAENNNDAAKKDDNKALGFSQQIAYIKERGLTLEWVFAALIAGFMGAYVTVLLSNGNFTDLNTYYNSINFGVFFLTVIGVFTLLLAVTYLTKIRSLIPRALALLALSVSVLFSANTPGGITVTASGTEYSFDTRVFFIIGIAVVDLIIVLWLVKGDKLDLKKINISFKAAFITAGVLFLLTTVYFGYVTSMKYLGYQNATFDFGIFAQMFENMATTGKADTTVERSVLMSHFGVHFSPFYYLLLPVYLIFRSPICLFYIQSGAVAAGVFAVYLIGRRMRFSGKMTLAFELIYLFYPCLFLGTFYDFHENKFLTVVILFLFYFIISDKTLMTFVFSLMLLSIKEDAAIYLIAIALFVMITMKKTAKGGVMLAMAVIYFIIAQNMVAQYGTDGVMMWRLSGYFVNGEEGFFSVFKSILFDLGYLISRMFTFDKFPFIIWMLLPVMFSPFMTKKVSSLVLLMPMIPINLMQSWRYQYDIGFQYTYGVAALIIASLIFAVFHMKTNQKRVVMLMSLFMCAVTSTAVLLPKIDANKSYVSYVEDSADEMEEALSTIPTDATVTAAHKIMPHLYFIPQLYTVPDYYGELNETEYYVIDTRDSSTSSPMKEAMGDNYHLVRSAGFIEIYQHN